MTGGSLPAMTFKRFMDYAHQGIELRAIPGIENALPTTNLSEKEINSGEPPEAKVAPTATDDTVSAPIVRPRSLSSQSTRILKVIERQLQEAPPVKAPDKVASKG